MNVLRQRRWVTETLTAEHHPHDPGMKFSVHLHGGRHHGIVIHCATERSAVRLFDEIAAHRGRHSEHPYLIAI